MLTHWCCDRRAFGDGLHEQDCKTGREPVSHLADAVARVDLTRMLRNLGANLRDAGALCAAYESGIDASDDIYWGDLRWFPGCGRSVPGTES